jgi:hypothetical protein
MAWLQRPAPDAESVRSEVVDRAGLTDGAGEHDSPALAEIFSTVNDDRPVRILDLGPALPVNLAFYNTVAGSVRIADLARGDNLRDLDQRGFVSLLGRLVSSTNEAFDLILAWDILDHMTAEQPSVLAHHLAAVADRGARIHLMTTMTDTMPAGPTRYEIAAPGRLVYRPTAEERVAAPNPPPALVERWLDPFTITRSVILRHGLREFIGLLD